MKRSIVLLSLVLFTSIHTLAEAPAQEGKAIFTCRCAACHSVNKQLTGPALGGIDQRRPLSWIVNFVQSSQSMIRSGDREAVALFEKFNRIPMPDHRDLTEKDVSKIVQYLQASAVVSSEAEAPFRKPGKLHPSYRPLSIQNYPFLIAFVGAVLLLLAVLLALVDVKGMERKLSRQQQN